MNKAYFIFLFFLIGIGACKKTSEVKKPSGKDAQNLINKVQLLEDSIDAAWNTMSKNEEEMFFNIKRLLQEIEYIPGHDAVKRDSLIKLNEATKALRYTQESMRVSSNIDNYDEAVARLISSVTSFAESVRGIEKYQLAGQLIEEINKQNQNIYLDRVHYGFFAKDYNQFIGKNKKKLERIDSKYESLQPKPLF